MEGRWSSYFKNYIKYDPRVERHEKRLNNLPPCSPSTPCGTHHGGHLLQPLEHFSRQRTTFSTIGSAIALKQCQCKWWGGRPVGVWEQSRHHRLLPTSGRLRRAGSKREEGRQGPGDPRERLGNSRKRERERELAGLLIVLDVKGASWKAEVRPFLFFFFAFLREDWCRLGRADSLIIIGQWKCGRF